MDELIKNNNKIITDENKYEFIVYASQMNPNKNKVEFFNSLLQSELLNFINTQTKWIDGYNHVNNIVNTQKILTKKNTRPTNREEKAKLLADAALKRLNKYKPKKRKKYKTNS